MAPHYENISGFQSVSPKPLSISPPGPFCPFLARWPTPQHLFEHFDQGKANNSTASYEPHLAYSAPFNLNMSNGNPAHYPPNMAPGSFSSTSQALVASDSSSYQPSIATSAGNVSEYLANLAIPSTFQANVGTPSYSGKSQIATAKSTGQNSDGATVSTPNQANLTGANTAPYNTELVAGNYTSRHSNINGGNSASAQRVGNGNLAPSSSNVGDDNYAARVGNGYRASTHSQITNGNSASIQPVRNFSLTSSTDARIPSRKSFSPYSLNLKPLLLIQRDLRQLGNSAEDEKMRAKLWGYLYNAWGQQVEFANKVFMERTRCRLCHQTPLTEYSFRDYNHFLPRKALDLWKALQQELRETDPRDVTMESMEVIYENYQEVERTFWENNVSAECAFPSWTGGRA